MSAFVSACCCFGLGVAVYTRCLLDQTGGALCSVRLVELHVMTTLQLSKEQASLLLPVLNQLWETCEEAYQTPISNPSLPFTSSSSSSVHSCSSNIKSSSSNKSYVHTPNRHLDSESESGVDQFSLEELLCGKKRNEKSSEAHNFLHVRSIQ